MSRTGVAKLILAVLCAGGAAASALRADEATDTFRQQIQPLFARHCLRCHGTAPRKAELNLSDLAGVLRGGESGAVVVPGRPDDSPLFRLISAGDMPPDQATSLTADEIAVIRQWIERLRPPAPTDESLAELDQHQILPLLRLRCAACHGRQKQEGGLDIRSRAALLRGGKSGPAIAPGDPDGSLLVRRIHAGEMPPKKQLAAASVKPVEAGELAKLRRWIAQGAPEREIAPDVPRGEPDPLVSDEDRQFWSFQPPRTTTPPAGERGPNVSSPIDAYIVAALRSRQLTLSPEAERRVLARRLSFDLLGLPPDPEKVDEFVADESPDAWLRLVDAWLASPRYGERWSQSWLDLAGYSDSEGVQDSDLLRPASYRYRDYVIRASNADKPYDRFVLEQLAGDELADYERAAADITPDIYDNLVATAFLGMTADGTFAGITGFVPDRLDVIDDQLRIVGGGLLGLTIGCARCHSHKFDPLPQRDYYRLAAIFKGALDEHDWLKPTRQGGAPGTSDRFLPYVTREERQAWEVHDAALRKQIEELQARLPQVKGNADAEKQLTAQIKALESQRRPEPVLRAVWDRGEPSPTYILMRGNYLTPGRLVGPAPPAVLTDGRTPFVATPPWEGARQTGLRLAFARWLTQPDHPLTARVFVNRLWRQHFGEGIVRTVDNFGRTGDPPSHPELLDWLARCFTSDGWSVKSLRRHIVTSRTYRQVADVTAEQEERDPDNRGLSRFPLRRLDAEALYDSLLAVADRLDRRPFGPPDGIDARPDGLVTPASSSGMRRRAIYVLQRRTQPLTLLADFDRPAMSPNCVARAESSVAPQALHLLNNGLVHELSLALADRVLQAAAADPAQQVDLLYRWAYARRPTVDEQAAAVTALRELRERWESAPPAGPNAAPRTAAVAQREALGNLAHAVLNSAEFLFVD